MHMDEGKDPVEGSTIVCYLAFYNIVPSDAIIRSVSLWIITMMVVRANYIFGRSMPLLRVVVAILPKLFVYANI